MRSPRHLHIRNVWEHSTTRKKIIEMSTIKHTRVVRICVTAPIYLPGPTNPWALHLPTPPPRTWRPSRASAWTRVASCHVSASPAPCVGYARPCHVASVPRRIHASPARHVSSARHFICGVCGIKTPLFCDFNKKKLI